MRERRRWLGLVLWRRCGATMEVWRRQEATREGTFGLLAPRRLWRPGGSRSTRRRWRPGGFRGTRRRWPHGGCGRPKGRHDGWGHHGMTRHKGGIPRGWGHHGGCGSTRSSLAGDHKGRHDLWLAQALRGRPAGLRGRSWGWATRSAAPKRVSADEPLPWPFQARWWGRCLQPRQRARARVRVSERDDDG